MLSDEAAERGSINLARIAPFRLGALEVLPAILQLRRGENNETLEARVMQVLVALSQAKGAVVARDDLTIRCWDGRIVGDNAIHRTISRLRDVASGIGAGCFRLETVNKVGYRLIALEPAPDRTVPASQVAQRRGYRAILIGAAALGLAAIITPVLWSRSSTTGVMTIAVVAQDHMTTELANGLAVDLARLANARGNTLVFASTNSGADYLLKIAKQDSTSGIRADASLLKPASSAVLWSASFRQHGADPANLRAQIANTVFQVTDCALHTNNDPARSDNETLRLAFSGCEQLDPEPNNTTVELWRKIAARNPGNARALATLAFVEATWTEFGGYIEAITAQQEKALRDAARNHLRKARAMGGPFGLTYAAEAFLLPHGRYADELTLLDHGIAADPDCADLYAIKTHVLQNVGRLDDAIDSARKAVELEPSSAFLRAQLLLVLAYNGYTQSAKTELEAAERIWPDSPMIGDARLAFDFRFGDPREELHRIDRGEALQPYASNNVQNGLERAFLLARASPTQANIETAAKLMLTYRHAPYVAIQNLVGLGRLDMAYRYVGDPAIAAQFRQDGSYVLFRVNMRPFLFDRRFMRFADRIGLVHYWQASANWPDFCRDKDVPYDCKTESRRLHADKVI